MGSGRELGGRTKKLRREIIGSVRADRGYLENKEAEREAYEISGLNKDCRESMSPFVPSVKSTCNKYH